MKNLHPEGKSLKSAAQKTPEAASPVLEIRGAEVAREQEILTLEALGFVADLARRFTPRVRQLLAAREARQVRFDAGELPDFRSDTHSIRDADWTVGEVPADLLDRRVEITGPAERKMVINALNSGAKVFMADFEDSLAPTWRNVVEGQVNLRDAVAGTIEYTSPEGKHYRVNEKPAVLVVRPRGWHLVEKHALLDGSPIPAALFDFGLYLFHNAAALKARGTGPYYYLPKMEAMEEAALWEDVITRAEEALDLKPGTVKVTVLIETLPAAFEMDEILHVLRAHIVGLNCGRWDYIFSFIKKLQARRAHVFPERGQVTMTAPCMRAYSQLLIKTCHRRGAFAMGGMAAQIPIKNDPAANDAALAKVRADKEREAGDGHDGTWVAHPALVPIALEIFDKHLKGPNQLGRQREDVQTGAAELLAVPEGGITGKGLDNNVEVSVLYLAAWLAGNGCVPIHNLMEDAATAEIARTQLWQWLHRGDTHLDDGRSIDAAFMDSVLNRQATRLTAEAAPAQRPQVKRAVEILKHLIHAEQLEPFLTTAAYAELD
ncbi:MAG TPA: malate synthase A [Gammaproteobacteria bacterium]|nr:malate synthase A [Gammaproteobacteria bacterium]